MQVRNAVKKAIRMVSPKNQRPVDFIICGTQKGGTTALDTYLREHPEICMATNKEVHFFDNEDYFKRKTPNYARYHACFTPKPAHKLLGESTPIYMYWQDAPRRIWEYSQDIKLIVVLRNPIERAYSHWNMERSRQADDLPFWDAIQNEPARCKQALPLQHRVYSYVDRGFYLEQLRRFWRYFPKDNLLIIKSETLKSRHDDSLAEVCDFLQVSRFTQMDDKKVNAIPYGTPMEDRAKTYLQGIFECEIRALERVLGWDCSDWLA